MGDGVNGTRVGREANFDNGFKAGRGTNVGSGASVGKGVYVGKGSNVTNCCALGSLPVQAIRPNNIAALMPITSLISTQNPYVGSTERQPVR